MKESSLSRAGGGEAQLRIVPLFEARATLQAAAQTMETLLSQPNRLPRPAIARPGAGGASPAWSPRSWCSWPRAA